MSLNHNIKALLVDDELSVINNLSFLLNKYCENITIIATATNVDEAIVALNKHTIDVVFLDIEMPEKSGFELFESTKKQFQTIFVTAYDEFAIKAFEVSAVDYLLKPVDINRLKEAVNKLKNYTSQELNINTLQQNITNSITQIVIPYKDVQKMIKLKNIICFEANESYCIIHCIDKKEYTKYVYSKSLKYFYELLSSNTNFFRTHRSWFINLNKVESFSKRTSEILLQKNITVQLSRNKVKEFSTKIKS